MRLLLGVLQGTVFSRPHFFLEGSKKKRCRTAKEKDPCDEPARSVANVGARLPELVVVRSRLPAFLVLAERFSTPLVRLLSNQSRPTGCGIA